MSQTIPGLGQSSGLKELRTRLLFVLLALIIFRLGAHVPVPGLDPNKLAAFFANNKNGILSLFNTFSGGALAKLTIFALGIMPYISASIIIQLCTSIVPSLEQLKKEGGDVGRRKISQYTRYLTLFIATLHASGMAKFIVYQGFALEAGHMFHITAVVTMVTGTMILMWLGEQITEKGIGNGISLIIFAGIVASLPREASNVIEQVRQGLISPLPLLILAVFMVGVIAFIVFVERAQRKIPVHYAKRQMGKKVFAAQKTHLPLKLNMAGVIPAIFAQVIIFVPATMSQWFGTTAGFEWLGDVASTLSAGQPLYIMLFASAVMFFCFYYTALVFNPRETADNLKRSGAFIPGIRPGEQTSTYIDKVVSRLTLMGGIYITSVALLPDFVVLAWQVPFYFGGTSLLIVVVVVMDFMVQVQSHLMSTQYESLMRKASLKGGRRAAND